MQPTLNDLIEMARMAGEIVRQGYGKQHDVQLKGEIDLVTEIDRRSEEFLLGALDERFPGQHVIAEESGLRAGVGQQRWIVDPLDGTVNYAHGIPFFSVSIAFAVGDVLTLGVVYDPMRDECFSAARGQGAWLNGTPLKVTAVPELGQSLLVTGFYYDSWRNPENNLDNFARLTLRTQGVRRLGSAALDLCYLAAGRFDGYWELRLGAWDMAAGVMIAQEAGALVTSARGEPDYFKPPYSVLAANPVLHAKILAVLQGQD
ncbi:MAG: inositol monophosphatase [Chloroflexi bacterium]|nr:inositol monophosphatase [Chloroflexota bacterium]